MRSPWLRFTVAVATAAATVAVSAAPALAGPDQIAYRCDVDICIVDPDAPGVVTNLTDNGTTSLDGTPAWSPDGTRVAFVSTFGGGGRNLFVMEPGATGNALNLATQLTFYPNVNGSITAPVWSRDGTKVAFAHTATYAAKSGVFVVKADGTTIDPVTIAADGAHPSWSPDGTKIAFSTGEQVYVGSADGNGTPAPLTNGAGHDPEWSPDGTRIAFDQINANDPGVDLHVVSADGTGAPVITPITFTQWTFAAWSPDGTKLAYRSTTGNDGHIRVVRGDGSQDIGLAGAANENDYEPSWSPDGTRVAFHGYRYSLSDPTVQSNEIYVVSSSDGSGAPTAVTTGGKNYEAAWRPDPSRSPFVPILTPPLPTAPGPAPASPSGSPAPARKPVIVWITKRIPYVPGSLNLFVGNYACGGPVCNVASTGTARGSSPPSTAGAASKRRKPKPIVVGRGRMQVPAGATRPLRLKLTRAGIALIRSRGNLTITVIVTTTGPSRPTVTTTKQIRLRYAKPAKRKHAR